MTICLMLLYLAADPLPLPRIIMNVGSSLAHIYGALVGANI